MHNRKYNNDLYFVLLAFLASLLSVSVLAQPFSDAGASPTNYANGEIEPVLACSALAELELHEVIAISARTVAAEGDVPAHCRVDGTIDPEITFQVNLPIAWNGRFYMVGNGGPAGQQPDSQGPARSLALRHHFVMAATDTGHDSNAEPGYTFAMSNPQKIVDYAYRGVHRTAVTAKTLANAYYGEPVAYSYWNSCSNGGRQGLIEAQRYPGDFDGIIANAPWVSQTGFTIGAVWNQQVVTQTPLNTGKIELLAEHVMAKCDAVDGLEDGIIDDPRNCEFAAAEDVPSCPAGRDGDTCLTPAQAQAIQQIYDGPRSSSGEQLFHGFELGSEAVVNGFNGRSSAWTGTVVPGPQGGIPADFGLAQGIMQYMVFQPPRPDWDYMSFDFDTGTELLDRWSRLVDADDINLREFRAKGGKLLMTYGWSDQILQPRMGIDYYEQAVTANGPDGEAFMRLFMFPGMTHCAGGVGPDQHDPVTTIIDWVETGKAPELMVARKIENGAVVLSRPVCPYPRVARYDGTGSTNEASNFTCETP